MWRAPRKRRRGEPADALFWGGELCAPQAGREVGREVGREIGDGAAGTAGAASSRGYDCVIVDAECTHDGSIKHLAKFAQWGWEVCLPVPVPT